MSEEDEYEISPFSELNKEQRDALTNAMKTAFPAFTTAIQRIRLAFPSHFFSFESAERNGDVVYRIDGCDVDGKMFELSNRDYRIERCEWRGNARYTVAFVKRKKKPVEPKLAEPVEPTAEPEPVDDKPEEVNLNNREHDMISKAGEAGPKKVPESYTLTTPHMKRVRELRDALSQSLSVIQHSDDEVRVSDAILGVRKANLRWLELNQKDLPHHAITQAGVKVAMVTYGRIDGRTYRDRHPDDWKTFKDRVETMRRACNMSIFSD